MTLTEQMLDTTPAEVGCDRSTLAECIAACFECAQVCSACADACLAEDMVEQLRECITSDLNCADLCATTGRILSRQTGFNPELSAAALRACRDACQRCATECESHAGMHEHCRGVRAGVPSLRRGVLRPTRELAPAPRRTRRG